MTKLVPASVRESVGDLRERISDVFDKWAPRRSAHAPASPQEAQWPVNLFTGPAVDLEETDDEFVVTAELPGLDEKDSKVDVEGKRFVLRGEKKASREVKKRKYHYSESSYGAFYRAVPLPCEVDAGKTNAKYWRGVLTVRMPKTEEAKRRAVRVKID